MSNLAETVNEVRRKLPEHLNLCLDETKTSDYCKEWVTALSTLQETYRDTRTLLREALLITQKLNRNFGVELNVRKDINQLILHSFSNKNPFTMDLKEKPASTDEDANNDHIFVRFLNALKESYDSRLGRSNQFTLDFQRRMTSMKVSFDTVRVLKNWSSTRSVTPDFNQVTAKDLRVIVTNLHLLAEVRFGSTDADILLSDAILTAETRAKPGQASIRDVLMPKAAPQSE